jgi:hypothetical protein
MFLPVSVIFFIQSRDLSALAVGGALSVASLVGLGLAPAGAWLIDRWRPAPVLIVNYAAKALVYVAYLFVSSPVEFLLAATVARIVSHWAQPVHLMISSMIAEPGRRIRLLATSRALRNVAMSAGSGVAALLLLLDPGAGGAVLVAANAASYLIAAVLAFAYLPRTPAGRAPSHDGQTDTSSWPDVLLRSPAYLRATGAAFLLTLQTPLLVVGFPLTVSAVTETGGTLTAIALAVNTVAVALLQVPFSRGSEDARGASVALRYGAAALIGCCVPMAFVDGGTPFALVCGLAAGFVALNCLAELWISAGSWGVALAMAPEGSSRHLTFYSSAESLGSAVGAGLTAIVLDSLGPGGWWLFASIALVATGLTLTLRQRRGHMPATAPTVGVTS